MKLDPFYVAEALLSQAAEDTRFDPPPEEVENYIVAVRAEGLAWFRERSDRVGGLEWCCRRLDLDPDDIRAKAEALARKPRAHKYA